VVAPICKAKSEEFDQKVLIGPSTAQARRDRRDVDRRGRLHLANCLNNTTDDCLLYKYGGKIELTASDASFMTHRDMRGHTGYRVFADSPRREKLLPCTNSCNAYYRLSRSTRVWAHIYPHIETYPGPQYNKSNLMMHSKDRVNFKGRSKHISRKYFGVFEHVDSRELKLFWTGTDDLVAVFPHQGRTRREIQEIQDRDRTSRRKFKIQI
jgi:hypothetical protein